MRTSMLGTLFPVKPTPFDGDVRAVTPPNGQAVTSDEDACRLD